MSKLAFGVIKGFVQKEVVEGVHVVVRQTLDTIDEGGRGRRGGIVDEHGTVQRLWRLHSWDRNHRATFITGWKGRTTSPSKTKMWLCEMGVRRSD
jgi:hypothetical protein